jgi:hypothetical protein
MNEIFEIKNCTTGSHRMTSPVALRMDFPNRLERSTLQLTTKNDLANLRKLAADRPKSKKMMKEIHKIKLEMT